ncbi:MAG: STAS/SEC14 domain-containing protein [Candidatus Marinimicrobia bacterium]|nr:STAS/SEC14 domain-containing protein [Candidatus Neomarinimicrobiota bacterium]
MYQVIWQDTGKIEFQLSGTITDDEFIQVIHQLESLCTQNYAIHVLFDAQTLESYALKIMLTNYDFYKKYSTHLKRLAIVSDSSFNEIILNLFNRFLEVEIQHFEPENVEAARSWIFPSKLP